MISSLYTRWLKAEKWLPQPTVLIDAALFGFGGYYLDPNTGETMLDDGRLVDSGNGIIVLSETAADLRIESVLAHEFRHHWQWWRGWVYDGIGWDHESPGSHEERIVEYYTKSLSEFDALAYELSKAPADGNLEEKEWVVRHLEESSDSPVAQAYYARNRTSYGSLAESSGLIGRR